MKEDADRIRVLVDIIKKTKGNNLMMFAAAKYIDEHEQLKMKILKRMLFLAKRHGLRYIYVGECEVVGCEGIDYRGFPAIWDIVNSLGLISPCGNTDQKQVFNMKDYISEDSFGAYNVIDNYRLTDSEIRELPFSFVITNLRRKLCRP